MKICETEFEVPDPKNPDYSLNEVDIYGHLPGPISGVKVPLDKQQHRLSIRKNLKTDTCEAYRHFHERVPQDEVVCAASLAVVVAYTNSEARRLWGKEQGHDEVCDHEKVISSHCRIARERLEAKRKEWKGA